MKRIFEGIFITVLLTGLGLSGNAYATPPIHVVIYGDSLTSGYQLQPEESYAVKLERKLKEVGFSNFDITNMGSPAETSSTALERLPAVLAAHPDIVVIALGANDAIRATGPKLVGQNLEAIVSRLARDNIYVILLGIDAPPGLGPTYGEQFQEMYNNVAYKTKAQFYPNILIDVIGRPDLNLADGYHPNSRGVEVMVESTYRMVDAGLRWKMYVLEQQEYQQQMQNSLPGASTPVVIPQGTPPAPVVPR